MNHKGLLVSTLTIVLLTSCGSDKVDNASLRKALVKNAGLSEGQASCVTDKLSSGLTPGEFQKVALAGQGENLAKLIGEEKAADVEQWMVACLTQSGGTSDAQTDDTVTTEPPVDTTVADTTAVETTVAAVETTPPSTEARPQIDVALNTPTDVSNGWTLNVVGYEPDATTAVMSANQFNTPPPTGQRFVTIHVLATFNGRTDTQKSTVSDLSFRAVGARGLAYNSYDCGASLATPLETFSDVFAGATTEGDICFLIDDAEADSLRLYVETFDENFDTVTTFFSLR